MRNFCLLFIAAGILTLASSAQVGISTDNSSPHNSAILDVKSTSMGFLPPRMTSSQRDAIISPAEGLTVYCTNCTPEGLYYYDGTTWSPASLPRHYIGELYDGGIVFWVDNTGEHGLIVSLVDLSQGTVWSNISNVEIGAAAQSSWNGQANSTAIMAQSGHTSSAAKLCDDYTNANYGTGIYTDWYLPAIDQLSLIYHERFILNKNIESVASTNNLAYQYYWSSTEYQSILAWVFFSDYGYAYYSYKNDPYNWVRAVRSF